MSTKVLFQRGGQRTCTFGRGVISCSWRAEYTLCRVHIICSNTPAWRFQVILKTLTSWFRCLIKVGAKDFRIIIIQYFKIKCVIWDRTLNSCFLRAKLLQSLASTCSNMPAWTYLTNDSNTYCWRQDSSICPGFRGRMSEWLSRHYCQVGGGKNPNS